MGDVASVGEIAVQLRRVLEGLTRSRRRAGRIADLLAGSYVRSRTLLAGSRHPIVARLLAAQAAAVQRLRDAEQLAGEAVADLSDYLVVIGADPAADVVSSMPSAREGLPDDVRRAAARLPTRHEGGPTQGVALYGATTVELRSGRDETLVVDLSPMLRSFVALTDHVESHLAAWMRREGIAEASLVINNRVCAGRFSCDRMLPDILPAGARLTLYEHTSTGLRLRRVYTGTGKGIM